MVVWYHSKILGHCHLLLIMVSFKMEFSLFPCNFCVSKSLQLHYCIILSLVSKVNRIAFLCFILANITFYYTRNGN